MRDTVRFLFFTLAAPQFLLFADDGADLRHAAGRGETEIVRKLLAKKKKPWLDKADEDGDTALMRAVNYDRIDVVEMLIHAGANPNKRNRRTGQTPFLVAAMEGRADIMRILLMRKAKVNQTDTNGRTALMWAIRWGHKEVVQMLLDLKADPDIIDKDGNIALVYAMVYGPNLELAELLIKAGANVNLSTNDRGTPIMVAANFGQLEMVKLLIAAKANVNVRDRRGNLVLNTASGVKRDEILAILRAAGARD